jgi:ELWxxDGT repeat protein
VFPGSNPDRYVEYQGAVYFFASGDWGSGLWRTDGTRSGTTFVESFGSIADMAVANGLLFISGESDITYGLELYKYDGFSATLVKDIRPGGVDSNPGRFFVWTDRLMFSADPDGLGQVLHTSDGTTAGTVALDTYKDPQEFASFNARVFFPAKVDQLPATETNLWSWSPLTGGELVESRVVGNLAVLGTALYMTKRSGTTAVGRLEGELWKTDGTPGAAVKVSSLWTGGDAAVSEKTVFGTEVFFAGCDPASGRNLYKSDGTTVTLVKDFLLPDDLQPGVPAPPANSCDPANGPQQLVVIRQALLRGGRRTAAEWAGDGTPRDRSARGLTSARPRSPHQLPAQARGLPRVTRGSSSPPAPLPRAEALLLRRDRLSVTDLDPGPRRRASSRILLGRRCSSPRGRTPPSRGAAHDHPRGIGDRSVAKATVTVRLLPGRAPPSVNWRRQAGAFSPDDTATGILTFPRSGRP